MLSGTGVGEGRREARAVHLLLVEPVDADRGGRDPGQVQHGGRNVDAVGELGSRRSIGGDPRRPVHDHRVTRTTQVAGHLLTPLERGGVVRVRPGGGEVRCGVLSAQSLDSAVLLDELELVISLENHTIEEGHLVERAGDGTLHGAPLSPQM